VLAETIELTAGMIAAGIFAIVGPMAVIGGVFVAWGKLRQVVHDTRETAKTNAAEIRAEVDARRTADDALGERLRTELDAHAKILNDRIDATQNHLASAHRGTTQALDRRIGSLERWRERVRGAEEARAAAVPRPIYDDTAPMSRPITTPRIHQSSTHYPAASKDENDD
jgi:septal ring factor EnvC (AmiA/AmiB activator)